MIDFQSVSKRYPGAGADALSQATLQVGSGELVFVTGHSGAGKSTLLRLIGGLELSTKGQVTIGGVSPNRLSRRQLPWFRRQIGMVFQDHKLLVERTVFDNVALPLMVVGARRSEIERRVRAALDKVQLLGKEQHLPMSLSTGEQQRVGVARAVVNRPPVLIADEPTGNLDPALSREVMQLFLDFAQVGVTVVVATHDIMILREVATRVFVLNGGRCREIDRSELFE